MLDSKPLNNITQGKNLRVISKLNKTPQYSHYAIGTVRLKKYKKLVDLAEQNFQKGLLSEAVVFVVVGGRSWLYPPATFHSQ